MNVESMLKYIVAFVFKLVPRNKHLWITGKKSEWEYGNAPPQFFDNSKYFYLYLVQNTNEKVYWLSSSKEEYDLLKSKDLPVVKLNSIKGRLLTLRAKYSFHHYGPEQIDRILQYGSIQIDFWHGTPLKKIRYDVVPKPRKNVNILARLLNAGGCEYISSTSSFLSENVLCGAFDVNLCQMLNFGYPRMDIMKYDTETLKKFCDKYSRSLIPYINLSEEKKTFLYMPTWRDDDPDYFTKAEINYRRLDYELEKNNAIFFLKLHPLTKDVNIQGYKNIVQISNDTDIYPFLKFVDILITDYSSIFFDFLPLDREIIFIPYDYENYIKNRQLYFDYNEITPGVKYNNFDEFINQIQYIDGLDYSSERNKIKKIFIENYNFDACEKTYKFFNELSRRKGES